MMEQPTKLERKQTFRIQSKHELYYTSYDI